MPSDISPSAAAPDPANGQLHELLAVPPTPEYLRRMWDKRDFIAALPIEELRTSHQSTLLGNVWHLGNPVLSVVVYYVVFGILLNTSRGIDNYILWLVVGVFVYRLTSDCMTGGARAISSNAGLMRAVRFPRAALPLSSVFSNLLSFGFELSIIAGLALMTGEGITARWLALPVVVLLQSVLNLGLALVTARLNDMFRDVQQLIPFVMRLGIYASGVMFDVRARAAEAPGWIRTAIEWNPLVALIDTYRWVFLGTPVSGGELARLIVVALVVLVVGFRFFVAAESSYGRG